MKMVKRSAWGLWVFLLGTSKLKTFLSSFSFCVSNPPLSYSLFMSPNNNQKMRKKSSLMDSQIKIYVISLPSVKDNFRTCRFYLMTHFQVFYFMTTQSKLSKQFQHKRTTKAKAFIFLFSCSCDWWRNVSDSRHPHLIPFQWPRSRFFHVNNVSAFRGTSYKHSLILILESHVTSMHEMSLLTNSCSAASRTNDADNMNNLSWCLLLSLFWKSRTLYRKISSARAVNTEREFYFASSTNFNYRLQYKVIRMSFAFEHKQLCRLPLILLILQRVIRITVHSVPSKPILARREMSQQLPRWFLRW